MSYTRRLQVAQHWFTGKKYDITFIQLLKFMVDKTCAQKALELIKNIEEVGDHYLITFRNFEHPLYYPKDFQKHSIYQVVTEMFYPGDWHSYNIEPTLVEKDDVVVDCGAAEGIFCLAVADRCKQFYAIEPVPKFVESMRLTFSTFDNFKVIPVALGAEESEAYINDNDIASALNNSAVGTKVKVTTIDKLFYDKGIAVNYIKADLEGYDFEMIKGARNTIKANSPKIAITTYHDIKHADLITAFLKEINPQYEAKLIGIAENGAPVMLHAWIDRSH